MFKNPRWQYDPGSGRFFYVSDDGCNASVWSKDSIWKYALQGYGHFIEGNTRDEASAKRMVELVSNLLLAESVQSS
jgi:hypothetical protein